MSMGLGIGGLSTGFSGRRGTGGNVLPTLTATPINNTTIEPGIPAHVAGDLLVVACSASSATKPTAAGGWAEWGSEINGARSISVFYLVATTSSHTISITGESGLRQAWAFRNAARDTINFSSSVGSGTTLAWEAQPTMAANCLVGGYIYVSSVQTAMETALFGGGTPLALAGMVARGVKNTVGAAIAFDSNGAYSSAFAPADGTLDSTTTGWIACAFSVKGA